MEIHKKFEELYECAERHDPVGFNRALYWLLREGIANVEDDIYESFMNSEYCLECNNVQPTRLDQMIIDGEPLYIRVCQDCGVEMEID